MPLPTRPLGQTGLSLTTAGFGAAGLAGMYAPCPEDRAMQTLQTAWDGGIRYFDTAPFYGTGLSEDRLGRFLQDKPRGSFVLSTKAGRLLTPVPEGQAPFYGFHSALPARVHFDYSGPGLLQSVQSSLRRLRLHQIDILYVHDIGHLAHTPDQAARHWHDLIATGLPMLAHLKAEGVIRAWGIGVNEVQVCADLLASHAPDAILMANRFTLLDRTAGRLLPAMRAAGVGLVAGGVLNTGILATGAVPGATFDYVPAPPDILARVDAITGLCNTAKADRIAAALQFPLTEPLTASVLIGAASPETMTQNLRALHSPIPASLYDATAALAL